MILDSSPLTKFTIPALDSGIPAGMTGLEAIMRIAACSCNGLTSAIRCTIPLVALQQCNIVQPPASSPSLALDPGILPG